MSRKPAVLAVALLTLAPAAAARGDKLVVFHNGRTLRVQEVRTDGDWSFLTLGKRSEIGVPGRLIASVTEVKGPAPGGVPNVQAPAGGELDSRAAARARRPVPTPPEAAQPLQGNAATEAQLEAARARSDALARAAARAARNRPDASGGQIQIDDPRANPGIDLSGAENQAAWPSLLDRARGRSRRSESLPEEGAPEAEDAGRPER